MSNPQPQPASETNPPLAFTGLDAVSLVWVAFLLMAAAQAWSLRLLFAATLSITEAY